MVQYYMYKGEYFMPKLSKKEIEEKIRKVDGTMAQEGMPITKEIKKNYMIV